MNIGIIGCGKQAPKHISGLLENANVGTIFVADLYPEAAQALAAQYETGVEVIKLEAVFDRSKVDGIIITTPTYAHFPLCKNAIKNGLPFLVEKPLVSSLAEACDILEMSKAQSVPGMVGYICRLSPIFCQIKSLLSDTHDNVLGRPKHAIFRIAGRGSHQPWKHLQCKNGGVINEMMVHMIDLATWYFGGVKTAKLLEVDCVQDMREIGGETVICDTADWSVASLTMVDGTQVLIQSDMTSPVFRQFAEINCENGIIEGSIQNTFGNALTLFEARGGYEKGHQPLNFEPKNLYVEQSKHFIDMVRSGDAPDKYSLTEAVEVMRVQDFLNTEALAMIPTQTYAANAPRLVTLS